MKEKSNKSVFNWAVWEGNREVIPLLLQYGAEITNESIFDACFKRKLGLLKILLRAVRNPNKLATRSLVNSCIIDNVESVELLLEYGADPNQMDILGRTPLIYAAGHFGGGENVVKLLEAGARVTNTKCKAPEFSSGIITYTGMTELHIFLSNCDRSRHIEVLNCVKQLIENGAHIDAIDINGRTPLPQLQCMSNFHVFMQHFEEAN